jgi:hypothetical protein
LINKPKIGRRPIKGKIIFLSNFVKKRAPNRPKADKGGFYICNLILLKNEPQIGGKPIKGDFIFVFIFVDK